MKTIKIFIMILTASLFILSSCSNEKDKNGSNGNNVVIQTDMDNLGCWMNPNTVSKGVANSGSYACRPNKDIEYGFGYTNTLGNISEKMPKKVIVNFWGCPVSQPEKVSLVVSVDSFGTPKYWLGKPLKKYLLKNNFWSEITETIDLPPALLAQYKISIYFWNQGKEEVLFDDMRIEFVY